MNNIQTTGPTALSSKGKELISHDKEYHSEGFGSPIGKLEGVNLAIEDMSPKDLVAYGIVEDKYIELNFEGGVRVVGKIITGKRDLQGKILLISFKDCKVTYNDEVLFKPDWGIYDMAVGKKIVSVFSGPASDESFDEIHTISKVKTKKIKYSLKEKELFKLYKKVRNIRENKKTNFKSLANVFSEAKSKYKNEWLILIEIYEIIHDLKCNFKEELYDYLIKMSKEDNYSDLINNGLKLIKK